MVVVVVVVVVAVVVFVVVVVPAAAAAVVVVCGVKGFFFLVGADASTSKLVATATVFSERKFLRGCGKVCHAKIGYM